MFFSADVVDLTPIYSKKDADFLGHDQISVQLPKLEKLHWIQISNMIGFILNTYLYNTKSLQFEWDFLQRVTACSPEMSVSLREAVQVYLTPAILAREIS